jgi:hypothetical protein
MHPQRRRERQLSRHARGDREVLFAVSPRPQQNAMSQFFLAPVLFYEPPSLPRPPPIRRFRFLTIEPSPAFQITTARRCSVVKIG